MDIEQRGRIADLTDGVPPWAGMQVPREWAQHAGIPREQTPAAPGGQ